MVPGRDYERSIADFAVLLRIREGCLPKPPCLGYAGLKSVSRLSFLESMMQESEDNPYRSPQFFLMVKKIDANQEERNEVISRSGEDRPAGDTSLRF
jgi:hypothetical protein